MRPAERLEPGAIEVPGDFSSAAFLVVAALLVAGSDVRLEGVGLNPTRIGLLGILNRMGAAVEVEEEPRQAAREPRGDDRRPPRARCRAPASAAGGGAAGDRRAAAGRARSAASPRARPSSRGAEELRHKESDRIATVVDGLRGLGAEIEATEDGFAVARHRRASRRERSTPAATTAWRCSARSPASPRARASRCSGMEAAAVSYPGFAATCARGVG